MALVVLRCGNANEQNDNKNEIERKVEAMREREHNKNKYYFFFLSFLKREGDRERETVMFDWMLFMQTLSAF